MPGLGSSESSVARAQASEGPGPNRAVVGLMSRSDTDFQVLEPQTVTPTSNLNIVLTAGATGPPACQ
jgi:hypothetical protein